MQPLPTASQPCSNTVFVGAAQLPPWISLLAAQSCSKAYATDCYRLMVFGIKAGGR